ncbi:MAG: Ig-like domain-containing protein [Synergistaceae bacterium]|nr:Ig-like domain-containing protein [Synergistaceae bacterium]
MPQVLDTDENYVFKTVKGTFTYSVKITDPKFATYLRKSKEQYYVGRAEDPKQAVRETQDVDDYTNVFKAAMEDIKQHGGGTVVVPPGSYVTGAIHFAADNTRLHLDDGAEIKFIRTKTYQFYPMTKTRFEGMDLMGFSPLIYAYELENIAITGAGNGEASNGEMGPISTLNGQGDSYNWLPWKTAGTSFWDGTTTNTIPMQQGNNEVYKTTTLDGASMTARDKLIEQVARWTPIEERTYADLTPGNADPILRPVNTLRPSFIEPYRCKNVLISDFYLINSPMWEIHPLLSENVLVKGTHINSHLGNNDGCNPESSQNVIIEENIFNTGDDCIAIKSGRNNDGYTPWNKPTVGVIVRNNEMRDGHGAVTAGSEMSGGIQYVFAHDNIFNSTALQQGLRIKTNSVRGGYLKDVYMKDSEVKALQYPIHSELYYEENDAGTRTPIIENIYISNYRTAEGAKANNLFVYARHYGYTPIKNVNIRDCNFDFTNADLGITAALNNIICGTDINFENVTVNGNLYTSPERSVEIVKLEVGDVEITGDLQLADITGTQVIYATVFASKDLTGTIPSTNNAAYQSYYQSYLSTESSLGTLVNFTADGVVTPLGNNLYKVRVSRDGGVDLTNATRLEVVVRNALFTEDQDFKFFSFHPQVASAVINPTDLRNGKGQLIINFDREMNPIAIGKVTLSGGAKAQYPEWGEGNKSIIYQLEGIGYGETYALSVGEFKSIKEVSSGTGNILSYYNSDLIVPDATPITGLKLSDDSRTLDVYAGESFVLTPTVEPDTATEPISFAFRSSNPTVAGVDEEGTVLARSVGKAVITVSASNPAGSIEAECVVTVLDARGDVNSVELTNLAITIKGTDHLAVLQNDGSYLVGVPYGTDLRSLIVNFSLPHPDATVTPEPRTLQDFSEGRVVFYMITSADGTKTGMIALRAQSLDPTPPISVTEAETDHESANITVSQSSDVMTVKFPGNGLDPGESVFFWFYLQEPAQGSNATFAVQVNDAIFTSAEAPEDTSKDFAITLNAKNIDGEGTTLPEGSYIIIYEGQMSKKSGFTDYTQTTLGVRDDDVNSSSSSGGGCNTGAAFLVLAAAEAAFWIGKNGNKNGKKKN